MKITTTGARFRIALICAVLAQHLLVAAEPEPLRVSVTVELGPDRGQNPGSLFEITDAGGRVVAGAGFLGAYNTEPRSERNQLQFFLRPKEPLKHWKVERLPAVPSEGRGFYPFGVDGRLYVASRGGPDSRVFRWGADQEIWQPAPEVTRNTETVAGKQLEKRGDQIRYDGKVLVDGGRTNERLGEHYFAQGKLFVRQFSGEGDARINRIADYPWKPEETPSDGLTPHEAWTHRLSIPFEFFYTFGQWRDEVIGVTNVGTVLKFDADSWKVLREPVLTVSYQIYCGINFYDKLLLGHYPTGEMFEYAGGEVARKTGWPPVMPGVASSARELQTAAIYGGDLIAGVWPWGEVWRYDADESEWEFIQRMFAHPEPTDTVQHPYEAETKAVDKVANLWGQRVTGLLPQGDGMIITTSSKGGQAWDSKFDFLSPEQQADYGAIYRATLPGNLAVTTTWKSGPTTFEFAIADGRLTIRQDGAELGSLPIADELLQQIQPKKIEWGAGVFGPFAGKIAEKESSVAQHDLPNPLRSAYIHPDRIFRNAPDPEARQATARETLDQAQSIALNAVFPYFTGSSGQAYYPSDLAPRSSFGEHDPLLDLVVEAKARGLKVFPVVCVAVCGNEQPAGVLLDHPQWGLRHPDGSPLGYLSPAHPEARQWIVRIIEEILTRYQPDGVVLDYIRFHNRPLRLDVTAEERFECSLPENCSEEERAERLQAFKEAELTQWVREISQAVRHRQPPAMLGMYCWGPHTLKNHLTAQVWPRWVDEGLVDFINISGYYHRSKYGEKYLSLFEQRMSEAVQINQAAAHPVELSFALGVNTSHGRVHSVAEICEYLEGGAKVGMPGAAYFPWNDLVPYVVELQAGCPSE